MSESVADDACFSMAAAERAFLEGNFEDALKHFFVCIIMLPVDRRERYEDQFAAALHGWIALNPENASRALHLYPQIRELFPMTIRTKLSLIRAVQGTDQTRYLLNCLPICKDAQELATKIEDIVALRIARVNLATLPFPQWHIRMINDKARNEAFAKAIRLSIRSRTNVVLDIGSGTGILSALAARQTNNVIALEENMCLAMLSKEVLKRNGVENRVTVHAKNSGEFEMDQKADVIVSETLDCCVFGERIVETFLDAHQRFAHENTVFIPNKAAVYVRLFSCREIFDIHCQDYGGVRYRSEYVKVAEEDADQPYWCASQCDYNNFDFLTLPEEIYTIQFGNLDELRRSLLSSGAVKLLSTKDGVAHGFAIHFVTDLTGDGTTLSSAECRAWDLGIIPFKEPCVIKSGEHMAISWKLVNHRLDVYNEFYAEGLQNGEVRYETATLEQIQKIRDDSHFKQMMAEVDRMELSHATDISSQVPVQCVLDSVASKKPCKTIIASFCRYDGTLDQETFFRLEEIVGYKDYVTKIVPSKIRLIGRMFFSDRIHRDARPDSSAHCGVDLTHVRSFNLREMRDIRLSERSDIEFASHEFELIDLHFTADGFRQDRYTTLTQEIKVQTIRQIADGVIYEFEILGIRNTRLRPVAAFLFPERVHTEPEMNVVFDMHLGEMLVSLKDLF